MLSFLENMLRIFIRLVVELNFSIDQKTLMLEVFRYAWRTSDLQQTVLKLFCIKTLLIQFRTSPAVEFEIAITQNTHRLKLYLNRLHTTLFDSDSVSTQTTRSFIQRRETTPLSAAGFKAQSPISANGS